MGDKRTAIVAYAWWGVAHEQSIHYRQVRPIAHLDAPFTLPTWIDCSAFVTLAYKSADAPDPNGENYDGDGFTGTLLAHCEHITRGELRPADLIVSGSGSGDHVIMALDTAPDPLCVSHGTEGGPVTYPLSRLAAFHRPPYTYLRCPGLDAPEPIPTPPEDDDMQHGYFVQDVGAKPEDPCWLASMTFDPILVEDFDVTHVVAYCTGVTIHPVPDGMLKGKATRGARTETTWQIDAVGRKQFQFKS